MTQIAKGSKASFLSALIAESELQRITGAPISPEYSAGNTDVLLETAINHSMVDDLLVTEKPVFELRVNDLKMLLSDNPSHGENWRTESLPKNHKDWIIFMAKAGIDPLFLLYHDWSPREIAEIIIFGPEEKQAECGGGRSLPRLNPGLHLRRGPSAAVASKVLGGCQARRFSGFG